MKSGSTTPASALISTSRWPVSRQPKPNVAPAWVTRRVALVLSTVSSRVTLQAYMPSPATT